MNQLIFLGLAIFATAAMSTNVQFNNRCNYGVAVIKTANGEGPVQECDLGQGQSCTRQYNTNGMNFKNGWGGLTLAEFSFNSWNNMDFYDLSVIVGFDTPMQISTDKGGPTVTCQGPGCPDAYLFPNDNNKTHGCPTGGTFQVTFCP